MRISLQKENILKEKSNMKSDFDIHNWKAKLYENSNNKNQSVEQIMDELRYFSAEEMEELLYKLAEHYRRSADQLTNMDAKSIASHLLSAYKGVKSRTGN